ncbi:hypothetical protein WN944_009329 [Citrus x changshan-huyou]|uniref:Translation initiation factor IF- 2 domain-containing protein n=1 Tax=Citrus x changshan-huyou TaxID=2935761 RepID=A0AAP0MPL6_9ROSI
MCAPLSHQIGATIWCDSKPLAPYILYGAYQHHKEIKAAQGISIGPVHKKDVVTASIMLDKKKEYAAILAFDVKVTPEAQELANKLGVKIAA